MVNERPKESISLEELTRQFLELAEEMRIHGVITEEQYQEMTVTKKEFLKDLDNDEKADALK